MSNCKLSKRAFQTLPYKNDNIKKLDYGDNFIPIGQKKKYNALGNLWHEIKFLITR